MRRLDVLITVVWLVGGLKSAAQDNQLRERFLAEAPSGWQRIEDWNSELECEGSLTNVRYKLPNSAQEVTHPKAEKNFRLRQKSDRFVLQMTPAQGEDIRVHGVNPHYSFRLSAHKISAGEPQWRITDLQDTPPPVDDLILAGKIELDASIRGNAKEQYWTYLFPATRYSGFGQWKDMITHKDVTITKVESSPSGGNEQVKVSCVWHFKDSQGKDGTSDITAVYDPTNNWALAESFIQGSGTSQHRKVFYRSEAAGGMRPPERVVDVLTGPGGWRKEEFVFTKYDRAKLPDDAFTLSAFGLPEPFGADRPKVTPWYLWLGLGGGLCLVLGGVFYWLKRRAATAATTP